MEGLIFHRTGIIGCKSRNKVLLIISTVQCRNKNVIISLDPGANISLLLHDAASRSGLKGSLISLSITKVGSTNEHISSKEYTLPLVNFEGKPWYIPPYGMQEVTIDIEIIDDCKVAHLFPKITLRDNI